MMESADKIGENARQGRRTLLLCFYAGHAVTDQGYTNALFNSNQRGEKVGGNHCPLEGWLKAISNRIKGAYAPYIISLFACDRNKMPEEAKRGGTDTTVTERPLEDPGQSITIHAAPEDGVI